MPIHVKIGLGNLIGFAFKDLGLANVMAETGVSEMRLTRALAIVVASVYEMVAKNTGINIVAHLWRKA